MSRTFVDETGRHVNIPVPVRRIVSLAPNLTEILYALGAGDRITGVSDQSDAPPAAKGKPRIGMPQSPNLEAILAARPDVVFAAAINRWGTVGALARLGIPVYGTDPHTVEETLETITHVGEVIGAEAPARKLVAGLERRLDALRCKLAGQPPKRVLFVVWQNPLISVGQNTFIADALRWAGAESVIQTHQDWPQVSLEEVVRLEPEYLVYAGRSDRANGKDSSAARLKELREESGWKGLAAVRQGHVVVISDEIDLPGPGLVSAIEGLARAIDPQAFGKENPSRTSGSARPLPAAIPCERRTEAAPCAR